MTDKTAESDRLQKALERAATAPSFYDAKYYRIHYPRTFCEESYGTLLGAFYKMKVFDKLVPGSREVLDYGCGGGHLSVAVNGVCYDPSEYVRGFLRSQHRNVIDDVADLRNESFDVILCSHALEHALYPISELGIMSRLLRPNGRLILLLPIERSPGRRTLEADDNRHLYGWNFQSLTNLLLVSGYTVEHQEVFHGPFLLRRMGRILRPEVAVRIAARLGKWVRNYPAMLSLAKKQRHLE